MSDAVPSLPARFTAPHGSRLWLLLGGLVIFVIGVVAFFSHHFLEETFLWLVGGTMLGLGLYKLGQWLLAKLFRRTDPRGFGNILTQAVVDLLIGALLLNYQQIALPLLSIVVGAFLLMDAALQIMVAMRMPTGRQQRILGSSGLLSGIVGLVAIILCLHPLAATWISYLLGLKLVLFGGALVMVAIYSTNDEHESMVYGSYSTSPNEKIVGELYAVTFGPAFHLGVYVGNDEVVDYHSDNKVIQVTWENFACGRQPQRWEYPDLESVPAEVVVQTARSLVGKQYPYKAVTFNCENFAIYCKSGGKTAVSRYAQAPMGLAVITQYPLLGSLLESFTRICNWIAYLLGGVTGRNVGLAIRWLSSRVSGWLVKTPSEKVLKVFQGMPEEITEKAGAEKQGNNDAK